MKLLGLAGCQPVEEEMRDAPLGRGGGVADEPAAADALDGETPLSCELQGC